MKEAPFGPSQAAGDTLEQLRAMSGKSFSSYSEITRRPVLGFTRWKKRKREREKKSCNGDGPVRIKSISEKL